MIALLARYGLPWWLLPLAGALLGAGPAWYVTRAVYRAEMAEMREAQTRAVAKAVAVAAAEQKRLDDITRDAAAAAAEAKEKEVVKTVVITKWATKHVETIANCPSPNLVRLHDAAATGADPESITLGP